MAGALKVYSHAVAVGQRTPFVAATELLRLR